MRQSSAIWGRSCTEGSVTSPGTWAKSARASTTPSKPTTPQSARLSARCCRRRGASLSWALLRKGRCRPLSQSRSSRAPPPQRPLRSRRLLPARMDFDPRSIAASPGELAGRVIAITGASDGIGKAVAMDCARHGAEVVLIGRNADKLRAVHRSIEDAAGPAACIGLLDMESALARDYDALTDAIGERYARLDGLIHNAAILGTLSPIEHYDVPTWCRVLHVNLTAAFALTQVLLPLLKASADASILFTTSGVGRRARAYWGAYAVSKFGIEALPQTLAAELENVSA